MPLFHGTFPGEPPADHDIMNIVRRLESGEPFEIARDQFHAFDAALTDAKAFFSLAWEVPDRPPEYPVVFERYTPAGPAVRMASAN
jgi:hypothetical protein